MHADAGNIALVLILTVAVPATVGLIVSVKDAVKSHDYAVLVGILSVTVGFALAALSIG